MELNALTTSFLGRKLIYFKEVDSTQLEILRQVENGVENGTIVIAEKQTNGIGTHGRIWHTTEENNIAFSFVIYPNCTIKKLDGITVEIAQCIIEVIANLYNISLEIKVPNDIYYHNKKIGGILVQNKLQGERVKYMIVGIGINTVQTDFPKEIESIATSIKKEFNIKVDREKIITEFCNKSENKIIERMSL